MKRILLGVISVVLILASVFGIYASSAGLEDIPAIERNKNLQAADVEDAIDLIEENLDEYNDFLALKDDLANPDDAEDADVDEEPVATPEPTPTPAPVATANPAAAAAQNEYGKWQATYSNKQKAVADCQAKYDAAASKVSSDQAALDSAKADLSAAQAKLNSIPSSDNARSAYNEYLRASENYRYAIDEITQRDAKTILDSKTAAYQSALGGYSSIDELDNARANANSKVSAAKAEVQRAEQQLAADQQALDTAKSNLDYANSEANYSKSQMDKAQSAVGSAKPASSDTSKKNNGTAKETEKTDEEAAKNAEETAEKLAKLKDSTGVKDVVEAGIQILLDNEDISSRVVDESDAEEVIDAAREYLDEANAAVEKELSLRQNLYTALKILGFTGAIAGVIGLVVMIVPKKFLFVVSLILSCLTAVAAIALNAFGLMGGYLHFAYERANGGGNGNFQLLAMITIAVAAILSVIIVILCLRAFKKALKMRKLKQQVARMNAKAAKAPR